MAWKICFVFLKNPVGNQIIDEYGVQVLLIIPREIARFCPVNCPEVWSCCRPQAKHQPRLLSWLFNIFTPIYQTWLSLILGPFHIEITFHWQTMRKWLIQSEIADCLNIFVSRACMFAQRASLAFKSALGRKALIAIKRSVACRSQKKFM